MQSIYNEVITGELYVSAQKIADILNYKKVSNVAKLSEFKGHVKLFNVHGTGGYRMVTLIKGEL